jgi:hypothetical protein
MRRRKVSWSSSLGWVRKRGEERGGEAREGRGKTTFGFLSEVVGIWRLFEVV